MNDALSSSAEPQRGTRVLAWAVLVAAVLEVVAPVATINGPGASPGGGSGAELLITPVGWAFSIWGVIYTLAIVQAVAVLVRGADSVSRRLQADQLVLYLGGTTWIVMAAFDSSLATAAALLLMFVAAVDGVLTAQRHPLQPRTFAGLTRSATGLYAGWVTAAFFLNVSTALVATGLVDADELSWQLLVLVVAVATLVAVTVATHGALAYVAAGCWALLGVAVTGVSNGTATVVVVAIAAAALLVGVTAMVRLKDRKAGRVTKEEEAIRSRSGGSGR